MTQKFKETGEVVPVTVVSAGPCVITQVKIHDKDGYEAVQIGFGEKKKINKPLKGHLKDLGNFRYLREFRLLPDELEKIKVGDKISVNIFEAGDKVQVVGISKGKGFQGVVKRHGFHGQKATHGNKDQERMPGSIGSTDAARVFKGKRMAGRMGSDRVTVKNLKIFEIDKDKNLLYITGAIPGARNGLILISGDGELNVKPAAVETKNASSPETQDIASAPEEVKDVENVKEKEKKPAQSPAGIKAGKEKDSGK